MVSALEVPIRGLERVLADWSGVGDLYGALAAIRPDELIEREWSASDVERRAMRLLLLSCRAPIVRWPATTRKWRDELPLLSHRRRFWAQRPEPRVSWPRTRQAGWPPEKFAIRRRHRTSDQLPLEVLAWTLTELLRAIDTARPLLGVHASLADLVSADASPRIMAALPLLDELDEPDTAPPASGDIAAVRAMGWPWSVVAEVAGLFARVRRRSGLEHFATMLLEPDGFPDRLFQLAILGTVLRSAESAGYVAASLRPIGNMTDGPVYRLLGPDGESWDLWCEAEQCWPWYGLPDIYKDTAEGLRRADGPGFRPRHLRPDVLLAKRGVAALVIECKYPNDSLDPGYVAGGMAQAYFYAAQLTAGFSRVESLVAGPAELLAQARVGDIRSLSVGIGSIEDVASSVRDLIA